MDNKQLIVCPSCESIDNENKGPVPISNYFAGKELYEKIKQSLYKCNKCSMFFKYPVLPKDVVNSLYNQAGTNKWQYSLHDREDWQVAIKIIDEFSSGQGTILDIGCYNGRFLTNMDDKWVLFGVEINTEALKVAQSHGVNILIRDVEHIKHLPIKFDVITLFDLIEHIHKPMELLCDLSSKLKSGGIIILSSGNTNALTWKIYGSQYWYCSVAEHIVFINRAWCEFVESKIDLKLLFVKNFSHTKNRSIWQKIFEVLKNIMYLIAPGILVYGRKLKHLSVTGNDDMLRFPPTWKSSKDHILVVLKKNGNYN